MADINSTTTSATGSTSSGNELGATTNETQQNQQQQHSGEQVAALRRATRSHSSHPATNHEDDSDNDNGTTAVVTKRKSSTSTSKRAPKSKKRKTQKTSHESEQGESDNDNDNDNGNDGESEGDEGTDNAANSRVRREGLTLASEGAQIMQDIKELSIELFNIKDQEKLVKVQLEDAKQLLAAMMRNERQPKIKTRDDWTVEYKTRKQVNPVNKPYVSKVLSAHLEDINVDPKLAETWVETIFNRDMRGETTKMTLVVKPPKDKDGKKKKRDTIDWSDDELFE